MSGTVDALIELLIPTRRYAPQHSYIFAVLVSIRIFISPPDLLQKILQVIFLSLLFAFFRPLWFQKEGLRSASSKQFV